MYYVEISDFLKAALPEITFTAAWLWQYDDTVVLRATVDSGHLDKNQLSVLGSRCSEFSVDTYDDVDEDGSLCENGYGEYIREKRRREK